MICRWCREVIVKSRPLIDVPEVWMTIDWPVWHITCQGDGLLRHGHEPLTLEIVVREIALLL